MMESEWNKDIWFDTYQFTIQHSYTQISSIIEKGA